MPQPPGPQPRLSYKFQRLRERLRAAVQNGEFRGKLPGERELAQRFKVNAKTINKALTDLATEGLLVRQIGRGTFVSDGADGPLSIGRSCRFRLLSGVERSSGRDERLCRLLADRLAGYGHALMHQRVATDDGGFLPVNSFSPAELRDIDGVVIVSAPPAEAMVSDLLRRHMPLVLVGTKVESIRTNTVCPDLTRGAYELTEHLILLGQRRIALVVDGETQPHAVEQVRRGYRAAMARNRLSAIDDGVDDHSSAMRVQRHGAEVTAMVYCGPHGERLCRLLAERAAQPMVAVLDAEGHFAEGTPGDLSYTYAAEPLAEWTMRLLLESGPGRAPSEVYVPGRLHAETAAGAAGATPPPEPVAL